MHKQAHVVTVNYSNRHVITDPAQLSARVGDTVQFKLGPGAPTGELHITFDDAACVSAPTFIEGHGPVTILSPPDDGSISYRCSIEGAPKEFEAKQPGGSIEVERVQVN